VPYFLHKNSEWNYIFHAIQIFQIDNISVNLVGEKKRLNRKIKIRPELDSFA
jgi:hypothetical protein